MVVKKFKASKKSRTSNHIQKADEHTASEVLIPEVLDSEEEKIVEPVEILEDDSSFAGDDHDYGDLDKETKKIAPSSALQRYLSEIRKYPLLTPEEEKSLAFKSYLENDVDARKKLVTGNLRLVVKIAMEYRRAFSQMLDLIQEGNAGLVQAVQRFNPFKQVKLSTYSAWWIRAYILKFLMDNKSLVRMGTTEAQRKLFFRLRSEAARLYAQTQTYDTKLLAENIGVKESDVVEMQQRLSKGDMSLDTPVYEDEETRKVDTLTSHFEDPEESTSRHEILTLISDKMDEIREELNDRDKYIFQNRILSDEPVTLQELGDKFGITRERARQLETRVLKRIKDKLVNSGVR